ncbi:MAG: hypothetical protein OXH84_08400 [Gammaproteobacteria bacterium]|nr:hypothetical protein [Gammaproteobacteria bacterium]
MANTTMKFLVLIAIGILSCGLYAQNSGASKPLEVRAVYPSGSEVRSTNQITIEFNQNVVALGASMFIEDDIPIEIEPALECEWNWVELDTLKCDLPTNSKLALSTRYQVTVLPGIQTPGGQTLAQEYVHVFETITPAIWRASLVSWISPTQPIIEVRFNQDIELHELHNNVFLFDEVSARPIPTSLKRYDWSFKSTLKDDYFGTEREYLNAVDFIRGSTILLLPNEVLSPSSKVSVVLASGVAGATGNLKSKERMVFDPSITTYAEEFRLLGFACLDVFGDVLYSEAGTPDIPLCNISSQVRMFFNSRFAEGELFEKVQTQPPVDLAGNSWYTRWPEGTENYDGISYTVSGELTPNTTYQFELAVKPSQEALDDNNPRVLPVYDGFGRPLVGPKEFAIHTSHLAPKSRLEVTTFVTAANSLFDPQMHLRNVDSVKILFDTIDSNGVSRNQIFTRTGPDRDDVEESQLLGLRAALNSAGVMRGRIVGKPRFSWSADQTEHQFFAQVTPYSVFFKLGEYNGVAWVLDLQTGAPIANATVDFYESTSIDFFQPKNKIFTGLTDEDGLLVVPGFETFKSGWDQADHSMEQECEENRECIVYLVRVTKNEELAFLPLVSDYRINGPYRLKLDANVDHWATTTQKLFRRGDTVHVKGYVRVDFDEQRQIPTIGNFGLCVRGPEDRNYEFDSLSLNEFGAYHETFKLNDHTPLGNYKLILVYDPIRPLSDVCSHFPYRSYLDLSPTDGILATIGGEFEVFEFKTNPIRVSQSLNAKTYERGEAMSITTSAQLHAGGPYADAQVQVVVEIDPKEPPIDIVDTGLWEFNTPYRNWYEGRRLVEDTVQTDEFGENTYVVEPMDIDIYYGELVSETAVASDRGKYVAARASAAYYGVDQFVGIQRPDRFYDFYVGYNQEVKVNEPWPIGVLVVSKDQEIVSDKKVSITVYERGEKLSGESNRYDWKKFFNCELISQLQLVACEFTPTKETYYRIEAEIVDSKGYSHRSRIQIEAIEDVHGWLDKLELKEIVELGVSCSNSAVEVGDLVQCEVKNHFDSSPVLVTIERAGILDQWLVRLDDVDSIIEFKVRESYAPHFRMTVLSTAPRTPEGHVGNVYQGSFFQLANAEFKVEDLRFIPLSLTVAADRETYSPRDTVKLTITSDHPYGKSIPVEYAVAVIDEALLDLSGAGEDYYDPTKKIWDIDVNGPVTYGLVAKLMNTSRTITQTNTLFRDRGGILYSRMGPYDDPHLNEKLPDSKTRRADKLIAYWEPSVIASKKRTKLEFALPDNLTSWKVVVMAVSTDDRFGFASTTFGSVKDTEIRPVAPNVVTEGDKFHLGASIYNRANRNRTLTVELQIEGLLAADVEKSYREKLRFAPQERKLVTVPVKAGFLPMDFPNYQNSSEITVVASAGDRRDKDALEMHIPVRTSRFPVSSIVYGALEGDLTSIPFAIPDKLVDQKGELTFSLATDEGVNLDGVFRYIRDYRYPCWEQRLTRALLAMQYSRIERQGGKHGIQWSGTEEIITMVLDEAINYQAPNGGMAFFEPKNANASPYLSAYTLIAFAWLADAGYSVPQSIKDKLIDFLSEVIPWDSEDLEQDVPYGEKKLLSPFQATVGAVILHARAISNELSESELIAYSDYLEQMGLFGLSQYLLAALELDPQLQLIDEILARIMNHRSLVDGAVEFVEDAPFSTGARLLHSDTRSLCSILESLTKYSELSSNGIDVGELKELANSVRYIRGSLPRWMSTQDNVFCTQVMLEFSDFMSSKVGEFVATVDLSSQSTGMTTRIADAWQFDLDTTRLQQRYSLKPELLGNRGTIDIRRQGKGIAFYNVELSYLTIADRNLNRLSGFEIYREYVVFRNHEPQILQPGDHVNKGEFVLVNLYLSNEVNRYFVVVDDTVPGGIEPVNDELGTESRFHKSRRKQEILPTSTWFDVFKNASSGAGSFRYRELGLQNVRYFAKYLWRGKYHLQWMGQVITPGEFTVIPTHVEEMYRPVMFGKSEPWTLIVEP